MLTGGVGAVCRAGSLIAGCLVTVAHLERLVIPKAEVYEKAAEPAGSIPAGATPGVTYKAAVSEWEPKDGFEPPSSTS
jgi:predicted cobalt transporter CbtA